MRNDMSAGPGQAMAMTMQLALHFALHAVALIAVAAAAVCAWRIYLMSRLPRILSQKLTVESLAEAHTCPSSLVRLPGKHGILVTDPTLALKLLRCDDGSVCREVSAYQQYSSFLGRALVLHRQATAAHRVLRSALLPLFTAAATRAAHETMLACTERLVARLEAHATKRGPEAPAPLYRLLQEYVLDITGRVLLAQEIGDKEGRQLIAILEEWLDAPPVTPPSAAWTWLLARTRPRLPPDDRLRRTYDQLLSTMCARMATPAEQEEAAVAVAAAQGDGTRRRSVHSALHAALGDAFTADELRDQTAGLLFAALNSAKELKSLLQLVASQPGLQAEVHAELDERLQGRPPSYAELSGDGVASPVPLECCARLVFEALRLSPGIEHLRLVTTRTTRIGGREGFLLPPAARLVISPANLHRHPKLWPQPCNTPRPEFFTAAAKAARPGGAYLPFSAGAKGCPAGGFALHEMRLMLSVVLQRFELRATARGVCVSRRQLQPKSQMTSCGPAAVQSVCGEPHAEPV